MTSAKFVALEDLSAAEIAALDFSRLVGAINEPNMPSGGGHTVRRVLEFSRLRPGAKVLEVGSNTGFSAIEIASWIDGEVTGVDINPISTAFARDKAARHGLDNVRFVVGDGLGLPFGDASFDLVFCSNVTSFIADNRAARDEYYRVLRPRGVLAVAPIYYHRPPPDDLRRAVGDAIGVELPLTNRDYWPDLFADERSTLIEQETYEYLRQSPARIAAYAERVFEQPHLQRLDPARRTAAERRLTYFYEIFDENLAYARYDILIYRANHPNPEPVLHRTRRVFGP
jgi:ubiquinone/menaquinone biosynthesis C-methylase UbiE